MTPTLRVYTNDDVVGVGAERAQNVYAIGAGMSGGGLRRQHQKRAGAAGWRR